MKNATPFQFLWMSQETDNSQWLRIRYEASCHRIAVAVERFRTVGIEPILIKGWSVARYYPEPFLRSFTDIDLCVSKKDYNAAEALLKEPELGFGIDLHEGVRHLDSMSWDMLISRSELAEVNGTHIRVPSRADSLRIVVAHWLNDGGAKRNRLLDIFHLVNGPQGKFDWDSCLAELPEHRRGWIAKVISICMKYEGMNFGPLPFSKEELELPSWLTTALETEWNSEPLYPLYYLLGEPRRFLRQLRRRFPPNPIQATIEMDAPIDSSPRGRFQFVTFLKRIPTALRIQARLTFKR